MGHHLPRFIAAGDTTKHNHRQYCSRSRISVIFATQMFTFSHTCRHKTEYYSLRCSFTQRQCFYNYPKTDILHTFAAFYKNLYKPLQMNVMFKKHLCTYEKRKLKNYLQVVWHTYSCFIQLDSEINISSTLHKKHCANHKCIY